MNTRILMLSFAVSCAFAAPSFAMEKSEYKAIKDRVDSEYSMAKKSCSPLKGNAEDICKSQAKGNNKIALAELEHQYKPSPKTEFKVREARADATYDTAKERCDDLAGNAKDVCVKDAKAAHVAALANAKVVQTGEKTSQDKAEKMASARQDANKDVRAAEYKAARERCDTYAGAAKDTCVNDVKARYGM